MKGRTLKKGGKYISQGSFGCGFAKPPLKCKNETRRRNDSYISKLFVHEEDADFEVEQGDLWKSVDPEQDFSIYIEKKCYLDFDNIKGENQFNKCTLPFGKKEVPITLSKFGGKNLNDLKPVSKNYSKIFKALVPLLKGLQKVHDANITHNDIKEDNIVVEMKDDSIKLRFIDFGLSFITKNMVEMPEVFLNYDYYYYWPFEFGCFTTEGKLLSYSYVKERYEQLRERQRSRSTIAYPVQVAVAPPLDPHELYTQYKYINFSDFKKTFERLDIYAFGIVIMKLIYKYFKAFVFENEYKKNDPDNIAVVYNINKKFTYVQQLLDSIDDEEQRNWNTEVYNSFIMPLMKTAETMFYINPIERTSISNVIEELEKLFPFMDEYLTPEKVKMGLAGFNILNHESDEVSNPPTPSLNIRK